MPVVAAVAAAAAVAVVAVVARGGGTTLKTQATLTLTSTSGTQNTPLTLTSSGGSGSGAVTYAVTDAGGAQCSISGTTLNASGAGTCTVTVTKASDGTYAAASSGPTTVTMALAPIIIPVNPPKGVPAAFMVTFEKNSKRLTAKDERNLARLAHQLQDGAMITLTYYTRHQSALAKARALVVEKFLKSRHLDPLHFTLRKVTSTSSNAVRVTPTKN